MLLSSHPTFEKRLDHFTFNVLIVNSTKDALDFEAFVQEYRSISQHCLFKSTSLKLLNFPCIYEALSDIWRYFDSVRVFPPKNYCSKKNNDFLLLQFVQSFLDICQHIYSFTLTFFKHKVAKTGETFYCLKKRIFSLKW